jgi:hypothetical protein
MPFFLKNLIHKAMADNKKKRGQPDKGRVNPKENYEMQYWKEKFGVSSQQITGAIRATGSTSAKKIESYINGKKGGR